MQLHQLFIPRQANGRVAAHRYMEFPPSPLLRPYIACYWASEPRRAHAPLPETDGVDRVLPDGCSDILFEHDLTDNRFHIRYSGLFDHAFAICYDERRPTRKFGVRFFPGGAYSFLRTPLSPFINQLLPLDDLWPGLAGDIGEQLAEAPTFQAKIQVMERYLISLLQKNNAVDDFRMANLLLRIFVAKGKTGIRELAESETISVRQMHRMFQNTIGISPKRFSEIIRFQAVVSQLEKRRSGVNGSMLALEHGFFDHAHMIRDFRRFYGDSPIIAVREYGRMSEFYNTIPR
ncbi:helix-turn-helix domain-containing protein [Paenibacillus nasutitermitis]|uniref:AraC family transcriptional regulator n=1 Tax=Paenibacillus nasutitermitis TaxID=1652958 RepID=A0A917E107_9BACL|nr:helix-turn-helix domain-containing protein [Paenibacillus nasutitermitis]GGD93202.1 AraC family transcriptional regulator [Paenibacillus nasutitermitis]